MGAEKAPASRPVAFDFALYFAPKPSADPEVELSRLLKDTYKELRRGESPDAISATTVSWRWVPLAEYAPPTPESFPYLTRGLEMADGAAMAESERVFVLTFTTPTANALRANRIACALLADLADATAGLPWDEECRLVYSAKLWRQWRVETWQGEVPDMMAQINIHSYRNPELMRLVTLGMRKFGLPDLVMTDVAAHAADSAANTINVCAQRLVEGAKPRGERLAIVLKSIRHSEVRARVLENPLEGAKGRTVVSLSPVKIEQGDAANMLWSIDYPEAKAGTRTERQSIGFAELFGSKDEVTGVSKGDPEMAAAREKAREAFFQQEAEFRRGLGPSERLMVKAPFAYGDNDHEYMWVEVTGWEERAVKGVLMNDPFRVKGLRSGMRVTVKFDDVYDYIHYKSDGTMVGNETGKVLEKREAGL